MAELLQHIILLLFFYLYPYYSESENYDSIDFRYDRALFSVYAVEYK